MTNLKTDKLAGIAQLIGTLEFQARQARARKQTIRADVYERHAETLHDMVRDE